MDGKIIMKICGTFGNFEIENFVGLLLRENAWIFSTDNDATVKLSNVLRWPKFLKIRKFGTLMLVKTLCWWVYDGDSFKMLMEASLCWWLFLIEPVTGISNRSPLSQICYQPKPSPTSVSNIDVTRIDSAADFRRISTELYLFHFPY